MSNELTTKANGQAPAPAAAMALAGQAANEAAARSIFADYRSRKAENTTRRQDADLKLFADYLAFVGVATNPQALATDPAAWQGVTWGIVEGFNRWQLQQGYSVGSVNVRLSTVKTYAKLAAKAGEVSAHDLALIKAVAGYGRKEGKRIDEQRTAADLPTRLGRKKREPVTLTKAQAQELKAQPDSPQGRRDSLLICLLLDHGLRAGEAAALTVDNFDLKERQFRFRRPKVDKVQTHKMTRDSHAAAVAYFEHDALPIGPLLRGSRKDGILTTAGLSVQKLTARVRTLGEKIGVKGLSAHDCRHYWATQAARNGTQLDRLQDAGGWNSPAMPMHYIEAAKIANEGVHLE